MKLAVINKEKCKPDACNHECKVFCPVEKREKDSCITISQKAKINEKSCIGCGICVRRCPFNAIGVVNLPHAKESDIVHRYGENGFALYGLPIPMKEKILGLLGRNGIGKSTAIKILSGNEKINFGKQKNNLDPKKYFKGTELMKYFDELERKSIAYKPQNLHFLSQDVAVKELLLKRGHIEKVNELAEKLGISKILDNKLNKLSGGELQKVAIIAASLGERDIYFFDEPLSFLDISERITVSDFIKEIGKNKTTVVIEHDILLLDYLTDFISIFYGESGIYGMVSRAKSSRKAINYYLEGYLKEENLRIRDKPLNFNFTKNVPISGEKISSYPSFRLELEGGFKLEVAGGEIRKGHITGLLGRNGIGKTTFIKSLIGKNEIYSNGKKQKLNLKIEISYKPQHLFTESNESVKEIILKEKINKKILSLFNINALQSKKLNELSIGELQRLSIARCISKEADVYFFDEPSAYLDVEERISCAKAIKEIITEKEKSAFVVDHDLLLESYLADSIINFDGEPGVYGKCSGAVPFQTGLNNLLETLDITLRKDEESGRPKINKKHSVLDRKQKEKKEWAVL